MEKKIVIEFLGMPGSGKTYYQKKLKKILRKKIITNNFTIINRYNKMVYLFKFLKDHPIFFLKSLNLLLKNINNFREFKKHFYYFYNEAIFRSYFDSVKSDLILVNSEGFAYRSSFYFNDIYNKKCADYLKKMPKINFLIYIESQKIIDIERTKKRFGGYKYLEKEKKEYNNKSSFLKKILISCKKNKTEIIKINNIKNKNFTKNIKMILKFIKK